VEEIHLHQAQQAGCATVDPENKIPLDINFTNNSKAVKGSARRQQILRALAVLDAIFAGSTGVYERVVGARQHILR
jgi:hypothetical protein